MTAGSLINEKGSAMTAGSFFKEREKIKMFEGVFHSVNHENEL